jgi:hypothetical protein
MVTPSPGRNWMGVLSWFFLCNEGLLSFVPKKNKKKQLTTNFADFSTQLNSSFGTNDCKEATPKWLIWNFFTVLILKFHFLTLQLP